MFSCINRRNTSFRSSKTIVLLYPITLVLSCQHRKDRNKLKFSRELQNDPRLKNHLRRRDRRKWFLSPGEQLALGRSPKQLTGSARGQEDKAAVFNRARWEDKKYWT